MSHLAAPNVRHLELFRLTEEKSETKHEVRFATKEWTQPYKVKGCRIFLYVYEGLIWASSSLMLNVYGVGSSQPVLYTAFAVNGLYCFCS